MSDARERLRRNYKPAFLGYLATRSEAELASAYALGRSAMSDDLNTLDLVQVHHAVFLDVAPTIRGIEDLAELVTASATFLMEALASFEMTRRSPGQASAD